MCASPLHSLVPRPVVAPPEELILPAVENPQRARINTLSDRIFYRVYSFYNPPPLIPIKPFRFYEQLVVVSRIERDIPKPYEEVRAHLLAKPPEEIWGPCLPKAMENLEAYADKAFREARAREYFDMSFSGRYIEYELDAASALNDDSFD